MKRKIIWVSIVLILSHLLLELSEIMERIWPHLATVYIKPIISSSFTPDWYVNNGFNYLWWVKYNCDDLVWCISFLTMARIAYEFSFRLFCIVGMFFIYHVLDIIMLWWDYKTSHWMYWLLNVIIIISVVIILYPIKNKTAILKQFN